MQGDVKLREDGHVIAFSTCVPNSFDRTIVCGIYIDGDLITDPHEENEIEKNNLSKKKKKYTWHFLYYIVEYLSLALRKKTWCLWNAQIAQLVEQRTENPRVAGSIPALGIVRV